MATHLKIAMAVAACLLAQGCVRTVIQANASPCSDLLPDNWKAGVPYAAQPDSVKLADGHDDARPWQAGFVEQTGQLEIANDRYSAAVGIVARCESRDAKAVQRAKPKFLGLF